MMSLRLLLAGMLVVSLTACDGSVEMADLQPVPHPEVAELEPAVAETINKARARLDEARAGASTTPPRLAEAYGRLGMAYQVHDFQAAARACYENAQRLDPDDARWIYYLAHVHQAEGRLEEAAERFRRLLDLRPDYAPARVHLADANAELNRPEIARELYEQALDHDGVRAAAHFGLGRLELRDGNHAAAVRHLEAALERQPNATMIHYPLARAYQEMGRQQQAQDHLDQRVERGDDPRIADSMLAELRNYASGTRIHLRRGERAVRAGQLDEAREAFRKAVAADPRNAEARYNLGIALIKTGREEEARQHLLAAVQLEPDSGRNALTLAQNLDQLGSDEEAINYYRAAIDRGQDDATVQRLLGDALMRLDRPEDALVHYRKARELAPDEPLPAVREAMALTRIERFRDARDRFDAAARAHPDLASIHNGLSRILATGPPDVRNPERALAIARKLFQEHRTVPFAHTFAMALAASGRFEQAVNAQRSIIQRARQMELNDELPFLEANLERFVAGQSAERPWPPDAQVFHPDTMTANRRPHDDPG